MPKWRPWSFEEREIHRQDWEDRIQGSSFSLPDWFSDRLFDGHFGAVRYFGLEYAPDEENPSPADIIINHTSKEEIQDELNPGLPSVVRRDKRFTKPRKRKAKKPVRFRSMVDSTLPRFPVCGRCKSNKFLIKDEHGWHCSLCLSKKIRWN